ncbi:NUDIX hydrolase [bacterium]|nr:NUDIX hydrolase [bacterium]MBU1025651.1 NUDIX hydrolase [bacterium]
MNKEKKINSEQVLVAPDKYFSNFLKNDLDFFPSDSESLNVIRENAVFINRVDAEIDESFRQIIPYVVIHKTSHEPLYYLFKRLNTQGEERLHNLYSLGAGGHINPVDETSHDPLHAGLMRELNEELFLPESYDLTFKGWIYSKTEPVSRVHAGMVFEMNVLKGDIRIRETDKMLGEWCDIQTLISCRGTMEGWSKIVLSHLKNW